MNEWWFTGKTSAGNPYRHQFGHAPTIHIVIPKYKLLSVYVSLKTASFARDAGQTFRNRTPAATLGNKYNNINNNNNTHII